VGGNDSNGPVHLHDYRGGQIWIAGTLRRSGKMQKGRHMTTSMHALLTAIGRRLDADYLPTMAKPLPGELKHLVAQLVALEAGKRGSAERPDEVLQSAIAPPERGAR
jgi:hypothetical protein